MRIIKSKEESIQHPEIQVSIRRYWGGDVRKLPGFISTCFYQRVPDCCIMTLMLAQSRTLIEVILIKVLDVETMIINTANACV